MENKFLSSALEEKIKLAFVKKAARKITIGGKTAEIIEKKDGKFLVIVEGKYKKSTFIANSRQEAINRLQ